MKAMRLFMVSALVLAHIGCAPSALDVASEAQSMQPIYNGTLTTEFPGSVGLVSGSGNIMCSGTLIHPWVVLTASHCLDGNTGGFLNVLFGHSIWEGHTQITVGKELLHPDWDQGDGAGSEEDVALLRLQQAAPIDPVPFRTSPMGQAEQGDIVTMVGFGQANDQEFEGQKRVVTAPIQWLDGGFFWAAGGQGGACFGDSGGSAYVDGEVAGIIHATSQCGDNTTMVRADVHVDDFIQPFLDETDEILANLEPEPEPEDEPESPPEPEAPAEPEGEPDVGDGPSGCPLGGSFAGLLLPGLWLRRRLAA